MKCRDGSACGDEWKNSVYYVQSITFFFFSFFLFFFNALIFQIENAVGYMGCYKDSIPHAFLVDKGSDPSQTTYTCSRNCKGYLYYALQGTNCYCGDTGAELNKYGGLVDDSECIGYATPSLEWAGAINRISVYHVASNIFSISLIS